MASVERWTVDAKTGKPRWRAHWRDDKGRPQSKVCRTKGEATRHGVRMEAAKGSGAYIAPKSQRTTVGELGEKMLTTKTDPNTKVWNRSMLRHVNRTWEKAPIGAVDHLEVQGWIHQLEAQDIGADTIRGAFRVLHEIVGLALRARISAYDPCIGVKLPKVERREMLFLSPAQINQLADTLDETWCRPKGPQYGWGLLVRFAAYTGCRAGEIGGLKVKHLDLLRRRVRIVTSRKSHGKDGDTKTGKSRWVDLPRQLCDELAAHLAERDCSPEDRVWAGERGEPLNHKWFYTKRFKPVVETMSEDGKLPTLDIEDDDGEPKTYTLRFHDLRHTCVALLIAKGAQQYEVMEHLGHTNIQTTINTYGHLFPSVRERIRTALEDTWDEAPTGTG